MSSAQSMNVGMAGEGEEALALVLLLSFLSMIPRLRRMHTYRGRSPGRRGPRLEFWRMTASLSDGEFQRMFRMNRNTFKDLCAILRSHISPRVSGVRPIQERSHHSAGGTIQTEVKVALFLRVMVGASFIDVHMLFGISRSSAYRIFRDVVMVMLRELPWQCFPLHPGDGGFEDMALAFSLSRPVLNPLPGCVGAVDGLQVQIERPGREFNPLQYFSRNGFFSFPVQAVVDAEYRFIACSVLAVGSTHDSIAFSLSEIYTYLHPVQVPLGFWVAGDEAYKCTEKIIIPFARSVSTEMHDGFNFFHSSHRIHVEQAFGILKTRWSILLRPLAFDVQFSTKIIPAAMKLHSFVINMEGGIPKPQRSRIEIEIAQERLQLWLRWCQDGEDMDPELPVELESMSATARRAEARSETRRKLMIIVRREECKRPRILAFTRHDASFSSQST